MKRIVTLSLIALTFSMILGCNDTAKKYKESQAALEACQQEAIEKEATNNEILFSLIGELEAAKRKDNDAKK